jgi:hypothetical protein
MSLDVSVICPPWGKSTYCGVGGNPAPRRCLVGNGCHSFGMKLVAIVVFRVYVYLATQGVVGSLCPDVATEFVRSNPRDSKKGKT